MRNEFLRDVIAGSAGVLVVLALIGLPKDSAADSPGMQVQYRGARLMPYYSSNLQHPVPMPRPPVPVQPTP
jgi:hypothetical protein